MKPGTIYKICSNGDESYVYGFFLDYVFYEGASPAHQVGFIDTRDGFFYRQSADLLPRHIYIGRVQGMTIYGRSGLTYRLEESTERQTISPDKTIRLCG